MNRSSNRRIRATFSRPSAYDTGTSDERYFLPALGRIATCMDGGARPLDALARPGRIGVIEAALPAAEATNDANSSASEGQRTGLASFAIGTPE